MNASIMTSDCCLILNILLALMNLLKNNTKFLVLKLLWSLFNNLFVFVGKFQLFYLKNCIYSLNLTLLVNIDDLISCV